MKKIVITILVILLFCWVLHENQEKKEEKKPLHKQLARAIKLENGKGEQVGTAFFVIYDGDSTHYYLVTARHLVFTPESLCAKVDSQRIDTGETEIIELKIPSDQWILHPEKERKIELNNEIEEIMPVDVAVAKIPAITDHRVRAIRYCHEKCSIEIEQNQFLDNDPEPSLRVIAWGFPADSGFNPEEQSPMGAVGFVVMKPEEPFIRTEGMLRDPKVFLLDAPVFPGYSGGPIFTHPEFGKNRLAGLVSARNISLNITIAEPVSRIMETLDIAIKSNHQLKSEWYIIEKDTANNANSAGAKILRG